MSKELRTASKRKPRSPAVEKSGLLPLGQKNFIIGIDDCICYLQPGNSPRTLTRREVLSAKEVEGAREWVDKLVDGGNYVCFFTDRSKSLEGATKKWLKDRGFNYHSLIMEKPHALRYHYVDDRHVQATTFSGRFTPLVKRERKIQVFG